MNASRDSRINDWSSGFVYLLYIKRFSIKGQKEIPEMVEALPFSSVSKLTRHVCDYLMKNSHHFDTGYQAMIKKCGEILEGKISISQAELDATMRVMIGTWREAKQKNGTVLPFDLVWDNAPQAIL